MYVVTLCALGRRGKRKRERERGGEEGKGTGENRLLKQI